jgi:hypothetical protein
MGQRKGGEMTHGERDVRDGLRAMALLQWVFVLLGLMAWPWPRLSLFDRCAYGVLGVWIVINGARMWRFGNHPEWWDGE